MILCIVSPAEAEEGRKDAIPCFCTQRANGIAVSQAQVGPTGKGVGVMDKSVAGVRGEYHKEQPISACSGCRPDLTETRLTQKTTVPCL